MTGQTLLDSMELLNQELQLQPGEADVTRGLLALNIAQDYLEARAALRPNSFGSSYGTITQTLNQEYTTFPTGVLRLDALQYVDPTTSRPSWTISPRYQVGSHAAGMNWLSQLSSSSPTGKPRAYWTNGSAIWWDPLPDGANTVRWYGLQAASDITANGTYTYPDYTRLPMASFAVSVLKLGVQDDPQSVATLAQDVFDGVLDIEGSATPRGAVPLQYHYDHR